VEIEKCSSRKPFYFEARILTNIFWGGAEHCFWVFFVVFIFFFVDAKLHINREFF
jgi:hypothetical protein